MNKLEIEIINRANQEESEIQKDIINHLSVHPLVKRMYRTQSGVIKKGSRFIHLCPEGTPDITGFLVSGSHAAIEVKTVSQWDSKNHGATSEQIQYCTDVYDAGGVAGIACTIAQVDKILSGEPVGLKIKKRGKA